MTDIEAMIAAVQAQPKTHKVVTTYADGTERRFDTRSLASAENHAIGECRKIGRDLIDRATGKAVRVLEVTISLIDLEA